MPSGCRGTAVARRRWARCPSPPRSAPARSRDSSRGHRRSTRTRVSSAAGAPAPACEAALRAVVAARAGMAHLDAVRQAQGCRRCPSARRCIWANTRCAASPHLAPSSPCRTGERLGWVQVASPTSHRPSPALLSLVMNELARRCFSLPEDRAISVDPARRIRCFHGALD